MTWFKAPPRPESESDVCPECANCWYRYPCYECAGLKEFDQAACEAVVDDIKGRSTETVEIPEFVEFPPRPEPPPKKKRKKKKRPKPKLRDLKAMMTNPDPFGGDTDE